MKLLLIMVLLISCTKKITKRLPSSFKDQDVNVQIIKPLRNASDIFDIINLATTSVSYGYWTNQTLNGSGTMVLRNKTEAESELRQFNRALSLFDLYFSHGVRKLENSSQDGNHIFWLYTPMENFDFLNTREEYDFPFRREVNDYAQKLFPIIEKQIFKRLSVDDYTSENQVIRFKQDVRSILISEQKKRLRKNWEEILSINNIGGSPLEKVNAYRKAYSPLSMIYDFNIDKSKGSYSNIRLQLPGPSTIAGLETKDISKISITPGLDIKFKNPIVGKFTTILSAKYLTDRSLETLSRSVMQVDIHKNFKYTDRLALQITFGSLNPNLKDVKKRTRKRDAKMLQALKVDNTDRSAALVLDTTIQIQNLRSKKINKYLGKFQAKTYLHKLALVLKRKPKTKSFQKAFESLPTFLMDLDTKNSLLSLRLTKGANTIVHVAFLTGLGFYCKAGEERDRDPDFEKLKNYKYTCKADLANFKNFNERFKAKIGTSITRKALDLASLIEVRNILDNVDNINPDDLLEDGMAKELLDIFENFAKTWDELRKIESSFQKGGSLEISI